MGIWDCLWEAFIKAGYREVGRLKRHFFYRGAYIDKVLVEKCKGD